LADLVAPTRAARPRLSRLIVGVVSGSENFEAAADFRRTPAQTCSDDTSGCRRACCITDTALP
jgi:hypothetical protein